MTVELRQASKVTRGITHIKPTTLTLETGHFNVLLGQTGSGKTSLIKLMAGLDQLASGQIIMDGLDVSKLSTQKRNISLCLLYTSPSPRDQRGSRMPSSA